MLILPTLVPYGVDVPFDRRPIANWCLIAVTTVVSVVALWTPAPGADETGVGPSPGAYVGMLVRGDFEFKQLGTHLLLHVGYLHLIGNMVFLFCFGNAVNAKIGHLAYLGVYTLCGAVGGVMWLMLGSGPAAAGASGAIMGIIGLYLVYFPLNQASVLYFFWLGMYARAGTFEVSSYWLILFYVAGDIFGFWSGGEGVAYSAHLGGALFGIALAAALVALGLTPPREYERNLLQCLGWTGAHGAS